MATELLVTYKSRCSSLTQTDSNFIKAHNVYPLRHEHPQHGALCVRKSMFPETMETKFKICLDVDILVKIVPFKVSNFKVKFFRK